MVAIKQPLCTHSMLMRSHNQVSGKKVLTVCVTVSEPGEAPGAPKRESVSASGAGAGAPG